MMKMYALYDTVTAKYATCLEHPQFGRQNDWTDHAFEARLHKAVPSMKGALTRLMWRLKTNVEMLKAGRWDDNIHHAIAMKKWSIECERRQADKIAGFGMVIVEVDDNNVSPRII